MDNSEKKPVLLQFTATWCGPCKVLTPIINGLEEKVKAVVDIRRVDVDQESDLAGDFLIRGVPTLVLLDKNGGIHWRHTGLVSEKDILRKIETLQ
ncbi:thioredoxin family protein [Chitinophaga sp. G-6-1-13]|uniref:Thioredoxin family protein n=1 Tax=Chitinophaga fulva TaxID=2728842 RepID=A0A848GXJ6_9BACT|nr:thioredoxin family protein [Chitinophaga fulva]NML41343.1 thioredoxin family protein [Chitinophaga fulva]